jgi:hypothetical protein
VGGTGRQDKTEPDSELCAGGRSKREETRLTFPLCPRRVPMSWNVYVLKIWMELLFAAAMYCPPLLNATSLHAFTPNCLITRMSSISTHASRSLSVNPITTNMPVGWSEMESASSVKDFETCRQSTVSKRHNTAGHTEQHAHITNTDDPIQAQPTHLQRMLLVVPHPHGAVRAAGGNVRLAHADVHARDDRRVRRLSQRGVVPRLVAVGLRVVDERRGEDGVHGRADADVLLSRGDGDTADPLVGALLVVEDKGVVGVFLTVLDDPLDVELLLLLHGLEHKRLALKCSDEALRDRAHGIDRNVLDRHRDRLAELAVLEEEELAILRADNETLV